MNEQQPNVALFVTCVGELVDPDVPVATVRVLRRCGATVSVPEGQTCCGQPAWNAGFAADAATVARTSLRALTATGDDADVVVPAGSCATMIKLYWPSLFDTVGDAESAAAARRLAPRVHELTSWLAPRFTADGEPASDRTPVAYHRSCHMERELHVSAEPMALLAAAGCPVADWEADDQCCGFGGTFSVRLPEVSTAMADEKLDALPAGVTEIIGADASCLLQLRTRAEQRGLPVRTRHIAEVLDR